MSTLQLGRGVWKVAEENAPRLQRYLSLDLVFQRSNTDRHLLHSILCESIQDKRAD